MTRPVWYDYQRKNLEHIFSNAAGSGGLRNFNQAAQSPPSLLSGHWLSSSVCFVLRKSRGDARRRHSSLHTKAYFQGDTRSAGGDARRGRSSVHSMRQQHDSYGGVTAARGLRVLSGLQIPFGTLPPRSRLERYGTLGPACCACAFPRVCS